jgi:S1-C subfamily serine protease
MIVEQNQILKMASRTNNLRFIFWIILLAAGFFAGIAWKSIDRGKTPAPPEERTTDTLAKPATATDETAIPAGPSAQAGEIAREDLTDEEIKNIRLFQEAAPSVCFITTTNLRTDIFTRNVTEIPLGTGSGFVWDRNGNIVTNYHVIQGADRAQVTLADGSSWPATLVGTAPEKDLAVLKIKADRSTLTPIPVGASRNLLVGQVVYAIGNPFGLDQTLTKGIISALGREIESVARIPIRDVIQTDAAINPGNSGGPLLDSSGRLIGVNTAIYSPSGASAGIGFSIPVDEVHWVVPELIAYGEIRRPTLGVTLVPQTYYRNLGIEKGALIYRVTPGSAAEKAGLQPTRQTQQGRLYLGDIIVKIGSETINEANDVQLALEKYKPGDRVTVEFIRDEQRQTTMLTLDSPRN